MGKGYLIVLAIVCIIVSQSWLFWTRIPVTSPTAVGTIEEDHKVEFLPSRQVIIRAVYLDPRPRNGSVNTSVFLVEASKEVLAREDSIVACGTSSGISTTFTVRETKNSNWPHEKMPDLTHDVAMIDCFGLPDTQPGSRAFLWYKRDRYNGERQLYRVESQQPYFIPSPKQTHNEDDLKIVVCMAIVRDFPAYMKEFLRYYKYLGVDHVYMTGEDSFFRNGVLENDEYIQNALIEGYISFTVWHQWLNSQEMFYHSQILAHEDCIYRFQGTYDYAFLVDSDDHFIPLVPQRKTLDFYIEQYCRSGSCVFPWIEYYPDCGQNWELLGSHGNITNTLSSWTHDRRWKPGKSAHKISAVLDAGTHTSHKLLKGYWRTYVPPQIAYVAHIRKDREPPDGLQSC